MRLRSYKKDLVKQLRDPEFAAEYLSQMLEEKDPEAFLVALRDVVEAYGGIGALAPSF